MSTSLPEINSIWREPGGSMQFCVVGISEDGFVQVKRADSTTASLATSAGAYEVAPSEWQDWSEVTK